MRALLAASLALFVAAPAHAVLETWFDQGEAALHAPPGSQSLESFAELLAPCDEEGKLRLPKRYLKDYRLTERDIDVMSSTIDGVKRYASPMEALKDGFLPMYSPYAPGVGLVMLHPKRVLDESYDLAKPDGLTYVKARDKAEFRLVGYMYVAGRRKPAPRKDVDFDEGSRLKKPAGRASVDTWDWEDDVCVIVRPGETVEMYFGKNIPDGCAHGKRFDKLWRLYGWGLVYNPEGLFSEANPVVDALDVSQKLTPLCPKKKR